MKRISEKTYKRIRKAGAMNVAIGSIIIVCGITLGTLSIIEGGKLLATKKELIELL